MGKTMLFVKSGGEGSRGGHVTGHTKSGKPIYAVSAVSGERYRGGAAEKRQYGGSGTITKFHIHDPQTGKHHVYEGHGPSPSARRENALQQHARAVGVHETHTVVHSNKATKKHRDDVGDYARASVAATEVSEKAETSGKHEDHEAAIAAHEHAKSKSGAMGESTGRYHDRHIAEHREAMKPKTSEDQGSLNFDKSGDIFDYLAQRLAKAGGERAGHKYISRKKNNSGGYSYIYKHPTTGAHVPISTVKAASLGGVTTKAYRGDGGLNSPTSVKHTPSPEAHEAYVKSPHPPGISHGTNHKGEKADEHEKSMLEDALNDSHPHHIASENKVRAKHGKPAMEGTAPEKKPKKTFEQHQADEVALSDLDHKAHVASHKAKQSGSAEDHRTAADLHDQVHAVAPDANKSYYAKQAKKHREAADAVEQTKKSEAIMNSVPSTPEMRAAFRGLDGPKPLAKGLYKFESYGYAGPGGARKDEALPDEYLSVYLDAFIEEAFEHEKCEKMHTTDNAIVGPGPASMGSTQGDEADFWAPFIMNELVTYIVKNKNLMRACEKHNCNAQYIADRLRSMNLVKPMASHATMHGDFMEAYMDSEKRTMDSVGKSLARAGTMVSEEEMFKAVAHGQRLSSQVTKTVELATEDDPITSLRKFHEKRNDDIERIFYGDSDEK